MPFKNFSDFDYVPGQNLLASDYIVGYRDFNKELRTKLSDLTIELLKNVDLQSAPEVLYVNTNGRDTNSGRSEYRAFRTLKRACAKALEISRASANTALEQAVGNAINGGVPVWGIGSKSVNIFIRTGEYIEDNPIYLPPRCTIIGDNLRSVTISPKNRFYDIIWVNNGCYVYGMTFRRHLKPSYSIAYPELKYANGILLPSYPGTRVATATATAFGYYNDTTTVDGLGRPLRGPNIYNATRETFNNPDNLSQDFGEPIFDPARIAFLRRYFTDLNNVFFDEVENIQNDDLDTTLYYLNNVKRPYTLTSPYPQGNSSITQSTSAGADDAGSGVLVDGSKVEGALRSMVMDSFTQFNEGGKGIHIINNGYAQLVSTFTICCTEGVICETGGTCSINTSNCSFGNLGLVALGKSPRPTLMGNLSASINGLTTIVDINNLSAYAADQEFPNDFQPYPGQIFNIEFQNPSNPSETIYATNSNDYFSILSATRITPYVDGIGQTRYSCSLVLDSNYSPTLDSSLSAYNLTEIPANSKVNFYIRSTITASAHTLEYIGTGTVLLSAVPQRGGQTDVTKEVVFDNEGRVFFTSTNQFGDFRIGPGLTIVQATGTIEGETFQRSILTTITPFSIAIAGNI